MPQTYTVNDAWSLATRAIKGQIIADAQKILTADLASATLYMFRPWLQTLRDFTPGSLPCQDGIQDYSVVGTFSIYRLFRCSLVRSDLTPNKVIDLDVQRDLTVDLTPRAYNSIRCAAWMHTLNQNYIRLEAAVSVPSPVALEIQGQYQPKPDKITALSQHLWFEDHTLMDAFSEGLIYWAYKLADDPRAGGAVMKEGEGPQYAGQYAKFRASMMLAAQAEDAPDLDSYFPSEPYGEGRDTGVWYPNSGW